MKTYVLTLSQKFPAKHPKHGEPTNFNNQLLNAVWRAHNMSVGFPQFGMKLHTIRANYELWRKRFEQIDAGKAILSVRYWTGKPYASKQMEICKLRKEDGIGLQWITFPDKDRDGMRNLSWPCVCGYDIDDKTIAANDGLSHDDWRDWFRKYDLSKPLAIIHFTNFRY